MNTQTARTVIRHPASTALAAFALIAGVIGSAPASAGPVMETRSEKVSYADLNVGSLAGAETLYKRIQGAARKVCSPSDGTVGTDQFREWKRCYQTAIANAVAQANIPMLAAVHSNNGGGEQRLASLNHPSTK
jgi:UrcA family protein